MPASVGQLIEALIMFALSVVGIDSAADTPKVSAPPVEVVASFAIPAAHVVPVVTLGEAFTGCEATADANPTVEFFTVRDLRPIRPWAS